jgi:hypothetical protein
MRYYGGTPGRRLRTHGRSDLCVAAARYGAGWATAGKIVSERAELSAPLSAGVNASRHRTGVDRDGGRPNCWEQISPWPRRIASVTFRRFSFLLPACQFKLRGPSRRLAVSPHGVDCSMNRGIIRATVHWRGNWLGSFGDPDITIEMATKFLEECDAYQFRLFTPLLFFGMRAAEPAFPTNLRWPKEATLKDLRHLFLTTLSNAGLSDPYRQYLAGQAQSVAAITN